MKKETAVFVGKLVVIACHGFVPAIQTQLSAMDELLVFHLDNEKIVGTSNKCSTKTRYK